MQTDMSYRSDQKPAPGRSSCPFPTQLGRVLNPQPPAPNPQPLVSSPLLAALVGARNPRNLRARPRSDLPEKHLPR